MNKENLSNDPREQLCWDIYLEKLASGIENAYQSAIEAGYSQSHAENITLQGWFKERKSGLVRKNMLTKAEKVLDKTLTYEPVDEKGEIKVDLVRVQVDVAKHITKTLGKDEGYSERQEHTGKNGEALIPPVLTEEEKQALLSLIK